MIHFRFRFQQVSYVRWRCRTAYRRVVRLVRPVAGVARRAAPAPTTWRHAVPAPAAMQPLIIVLQVGRFVVGHEGDPQLHGHPDIRYY